LAWVNSKSLPQVLKTSRNPHLKAKQSDWEGNDSILSMLFSSQPALRHFAVLNLVKRRRFGSIWLVKDRRGLGANQHLLVPSKSRAWPLLLSSLHQQQASPVRLRNGKVALLINVSDVKVIVDALREPRTSRAQKLNAISGFEMAGTNSKRKIAQAAVIVVVVALFVALLPKPVIADVEVTEPIQKKIDKCALPIQVNSEVFGQVAQSKSISIGGSKYKVAAVQKLGGLTQLKLKRTCDQKYFRVDAWSQNNQVIVFKVY